MNQEINFTKLKPSLLNTIELQNKEFNLKNFINYLFRVPTAGFLFLFGLFILLSSIYGLKDSFKILKQLIYYQGDGVKGLSLEAKLNLFKYFFTGFSGIIAGNLFILSSFTIITKKKSSLKYFLMGMGVFVLNFFLALVFSFFNIFFD